MPVDPNMWGVYDWTLVTDELTYTGHTVVRGEQASEVSGVDIAPGTETWFFDAVHEQGGEPTFALRLEFQRPPTDRRLYTTLRHIFDSEVELGSMLIEPQWQEGAPLSETPTMTLSACEGPAACEGGLERISIQFPHPREALPTIYADSEAIVSVFSGEATEFELQEGDTALFGAVDEGEAGHPDSSWFFVGFDPS